MVEAIRLGGVWAEWQARLEEADFRASTAEQNELLQRVKYEEVCAEYEELKEAHHTLAHSLTSVSLEDKNKQEILEIIKQEKFNLEKRTAGLEAQRDFNEAMQTQMKERIVALEEECRDWLNRVDKQLVESETQKKTISSLQVKLAKSEQREETLHGQVQQLQNQVETLLRSVDTKSRQLQVLCKERDRLKTDNATLSKVAAGGYTPRVRVASPAPPANGAPTTPCKQRCSPFSVTATAASTPLSSPAPRARQDGSPSGDPYVWLLDTRSSSSSNSPAAVAAVASPASDRINMSNLLKKILNE